jgi:hypothetical protein
MRAEADQSGAKAVIVGRPLFLARCKGAWQRLFGRLSRLKRWAWPLTIVIALIYTACFVSFINRHTSLPFYDGYVYVLKTLNLAEKFHEASLFQRLNPALYFGGIQPERPPLMIGLAAIVLGPNPDIASIAYVWLAVRVIVILLALYLLSREFGTARFGPAVALVIFGSPLMCNYYRLYFMDEPFAAFGLLVFALILIDDRHQTMRSAMGAAAGILALFLVKPVAPAFVFPFCVIRAVRALPDLRTNVRQLVGWGFPYLLLFCAMLALVYATPYGPGIREQFKLGSLGYWHKQVSALQAFELVSLLLPPWVLFTLVIVLPFARGFQHRLILLYALGGLLWWLLFSFFLTYTVADRLLGQAMPYVVTAILIWACQRASVTLIVSVVAGFFFTYNMLVANGGMTPRYHGSIATTVRFLSPVPQYQRPVPEVGLLPFAVQLCTVITTEKSTTVYGIFGDNYVEPNSLNLALRMSKHPQNLLVRWVPANPARFDVARFCKARWFITKTRRPHAGVSKTGLWTTIDSIHALITDAQSPLHPHFRKVFESPIRQPDLGDTLVLWHLPSPPSNAAIAEALRWLRPRLTNDPPAFRAAIDLQLEALSRN